MSEHSTQPAAGAHADSGKTVRLVVRIVLFAILLYMVGALVFDRFVARPGQEAGKKKVDELVEKGKTQSIEDSKADPITNETVAHALGFKPAHTKTEKYYTQETYKWQGGLPLIRTYNVYAIYQVKPKTGKLMLINVFGNEGVDDAVLPKELLPEDFLNGLKAGKPTGPPGSSAPPGVGPTVGPPGGGPRGPGTPTRPTAEDDAKKPAGEDATK